MAIHHNPLLHKIGTIITRVMLSPPLRGWAPATRAYTQLYLFGKGLAEKREKNFFQQHLKPGMTVFDIGANIGFYTTIFADLIGSNGSIHAFEPDPFCYGILRDRTRNREGAAIGAQQLALGDKNGETTLFCSNLSRADNRIHPFASDVPVETLTVQMRTLDSYCEEKKITHIDVIKMDVEGAEVSVLRGMEKVMRTSPPSWMYVEFCPSYLRGAGSDTETFRAMLEGYGYELFTFDSDENPILIEDFDAFTKKYEESYTNIWARRKS